MKRRMVLACLICAVAVSFSQAKVYQLTPSDHWFDVLHGGKLQPGDDVILQGGVYSDRRRLEMNHRGTRGQPVVIRGSDHVPAVFKRPDARQNTINMVGCQYLVLRNIEITGGSSAIRISKSGSHMAKFITLEDLHIHHVGGSAVTANNAGNTYEGMRFRRNHIHHTGGHGEAFYLGVNNAKDGSTPGYIFNSFIEQNYIHHLNGGNISQGDGIEIKDGSYNNIVRDNVIHDTRYPGILVYGTDGKAPNIIERNVIWNTRDNGIQAAAEAIIRNNIIYNAGGDVLHCRHHQSAVPGNLKILHNTIIAGGKGKTAVRVYMPKSGKLTGPVLVANNAIYTTPGALALNVPNCADVTLRGNVGVGRIAGPKATPAQWNGAGSIGTDLKHYFPQPGSILIGVAAKPYLATDDFNGTPRTGSLDVGAYRFHPNGNPGWQITAGFKKMSTLSKP